MLPDPTELKELDNALEAFDEAYVRLVQATKRIQRIYEIEKKRPKQVPPVEMTLQTEMSGKFCPKCGGLRLRHKGGGCVSCLDCGFDLGCGGA